MTFQAPLVGVWLGLACLFAVTATGRLSAEVLHWTGQGGGGDVNAWDNPANWLEGRVPSATDRASLEGAGAQAVIRGAVTVAELNLGPGSLLDVAGAQGQLEVTGTVVLQAGFRVYGGARMSLPGVVTLSETGGRVIDVEVQGVGSQLQWPNLTQIQLTTEGLTQLNLAARDGGRIQLPALTRSQGLVWFSVTGTPGGEIDLPVLAEYEGGPRDAGLAVRGQGVLHTPSLRSLRLGVLYAVGGAVDVTKLAIIDTAYISVGNGLQLTFPAVTGITNRLFRDTRLTVGVEDGGGVLALPNLTTLARSSDGGWSRFYAQVGGKLQLPKLAEVAVRTTIELSGPQTLLEAPVLANFSGDLDQNSYLSLGNSAEAMLGTTAGGTTIRRGAVNLGSGAVVHTPQLRLQPGGALAGVGQVTGNVANAGYVECVSAYEPLRIVGDYSQDAAAALYVRITGAAAPADIRQLVVTGNASLAGQLSVRTDTGFTPVLGDRFAVVLAGTLLGEFERYNQFRLSDTAEYRVEYAAGRVEVYAHAADRPSVVKLQPDSAVVQSISEFVVTFSERVQPSRVLAWLNRPDYTQLTAIITQMSATEFRLSFPLQEKEGAYLLTVYEAVADWADNALTGQSRWSIQVEPDASKTYAQWRLDRFGPVDGLNEDISGGNADPDSDGLVNLTEYYNDTDPKKFDTDGDGYSDGAELRVGANPLDPASTPKEEIQIIPAVDLQFRTKLGVTYQLQLSTDLVTWTDYGGSFAGTGDTYQQYITLWDQRVQFFRMKRL